MGYYIEVKKEELVYNGIEIKIEEGYRIHHTTTSSSKSDGYAREFETKSVRELTYTDVSIGYIATHNLWVRHRTDSVEKMKSFIDNELPALLIEAQEESDLNHLNFLIKSLKTVEFGHKCRTEAPEEFKKEVESLLRTGDNFKHPKLEYSIPYEGLQKYWMEAPVDVPQFVYGENIITFEVGDFPCYKMYSKNPTPKKTKIIKKEVKKEVKNEWHNNPFANL